MSDAIRRLGWSVVALGALVIAGGLHEIALADSAVQCDLTLYTQSPSNPDLVGDGYGDLGTSYTCDGPCNNQQPCDIVEHEPEPGFEKFFTNEVQLRCRCGGEPLGIGCLTTIVFNASHTLYQSYCQGTCAEGLTCKQPAGGADPSPQWHSNNPGHPSARAYNCSCQ